jgi:hypothetical protein
MEGDASDSLTARAVGESEMVPFTNDESLKSISDSATPLADAGEARGGQINLLIPFLIAVACIGILIFLLWRKTRLV